MLSPKLLKAIAPAIAPSVSTLFNSSLQQGRTPANWKEANVTPVFKSWDRQVISNYHPISVLPALAKVLESIVCDQLTEFLEKNCLLCDEQCGFRIGRTTQDVLLKTTEDWRQALDEIKVVATAVLDLRRAFDSINHKLLIDKMLCYGK